MDFRTALLNPLTIAGFSVMQGKPLDQALGQAALLQEQQRQSEMQKYEFEKTKRRDLLAQSLPDVLQELRGQEPQMVFEKLVNLGLDPKEAVLFSKNISSVPNQRTPEQEFNIESKLRNEFIGQSKDWRIINDSYGKILASAEAPSVAGDIALIYSYMKMLDPNSVVREGEYATAENAGSIPTRIRNQLNQAIDGKSLLPMQRNDFVERAAKLYKVKLKDQEKLEKTYGGLANRKTVNPENVVIKYGDNSEVPKSPQSPQLPQPNMNSPKISNSMGNSSVQKEAPSLSSHLKQFTQQFTPEQAKNEIERRKKLRGM